MRANHFVTLGLCVGIVGLGAAVASCGTDTSGTCTDTNSCGPGSEGGADGESDVNLSDTETGPAEGGPNDGGDAKTDGPNDGPLMCEAGLQDCNGKCVNTGNDPNNCGACGHICPVPDAGMAVASCSGSPPKCGFMCGSGYHDCNGQCLSNGDDPSSDPCVVANGLGIFVSPGGNDSTGDGTKAMPYATIKKAADVAAMGKKRVYACGTFTSAVALTAADDGVTIYGGLDCATWAYSMSTPTTVAPTASGYALQVTGASTNGVTFEDFTFTSVVGTNPGDSSIAVFASSAALTLKRCTVKAGLAVQGQDQVQPAPFSGPAPTGASSSGLTTPNPQCSTSVGGAGSPATAGGANGGSGQPGLSNGQTASECSTGDNTSDRGAAGAPGGDGSGAPGWATFIASGWTPASGQPGTSGSVGQGGGGGASTGVVTAGLGGGAGGCGGAGGPPGGGGGSSIAVLDYMSAVDLESCSLQTANAGRGGSGARGQTGQTGGAGGTTPGACSGGVGGDGGSGGTGGGGAGGLSAGVVWTGMQPTVNGGMAAFGTAGTAGAGGNGTACGMTGSNCGKTGTSGAVVQFQ